MMSPPAVDRHPHLEAFQTHLVAVKNASTKTIETYSRAVGAFLQEYPTPERVTPAQANTYTQSLGATHAASTQALHLSALRQFYEFLIKQQWLPNSQENPFARIASPKLPQTLPKALSEKQAKQLLTCLTKNDAHTLRLRLILQLLYGAGLRVSELTALTVSDTALITENNLLTITGKGGKTRMIPVGKTVKSTLVLYMETARDQFFARKATAVHTNALFPSYRGKAISRQRIFQLIQGLGEACGIAHLSPHTLRHTFATHLVQNNADLFSVQQLLGHASLNTTQIYTKVNTEHARKILETNHPLALGE